MKRAPEVPSDWHPFAVFYKTKVYHIAIKNLKLHLGQVTYTLVYDEHYQKRKVDRDLQQAFAHYLIQFAFKGVDNKKLDKEQTKQVELNEDKNV